MKTNAEINIAIAEACGWKWYRLPVSITDGDRRYRCLFLPELHEYEGQSETWLVRANGSEKICNYAYMEREGRVSDYCKDLNAMHEAEEQLTPQQQDKYRDYLAIVTTVKRYPKDIDTAEQYCRENEWAYCHATAHQRAEAFLKTIGKWE